MNTFRLQYVKGCLWCRRYRHMYPAIRTCLRHQRTDIWQSLHGTMSRHSPRRRMQNHLHRRIRTRMWSSPSTMCHFPLWTCSSDFWQPLQSTKPPRNWHHTMNMRRYRQRPTHTRHTTMIWSPSHQIQKPNRLSSSWPTHQRRSYQNDHRNSRTSWDRNPIQKRYVMRMDRRKNYRSDPHPVRPPIMSAGIISWRWWWKIYAQTTHRISTNGYRTWETCMTRGRQCSPSTDFWFCNTMTHHKRALYQHPTPHVRHLPS